MRSLITAAVAVVALAAPLVLAGTATASTTHPADCCANVGHALHMWHVAHVEHEAYMASLGY